MIAFDVGANDGSDSHRLHSQGYKVHAFEPAPVMVHRIRERWGEPFIIVEAAVSDYNGTADFHLAEHNDHGVSSLLPFADDLSAWDKRGDLYYDRTISVPVIRLDTYMRAHRIKTVDYLHVDAQGADLFVLMGLGDLYDRVKAGVVEMPANPSKALYAGQPSADDAIAWLTRHGFTIGKQRGQSSGNEVNIEFRR